MRAADSGIVVNVSAIAGFRSVPGRGLYASTKFAVEGFSEALCEELALLGITAGVVEPGCLRTGFLDSSSLHVSERIADYAETAAGQVRTIAPGFNRRQSGDPVKGAAVIVDAIEAVPSRCDSSSDPTRSTW